MPRKRKKTDIFVSPSRLLTDDEEAIVRTQIKRNALTIDWIIKRIDLLANQERCPKDANTLLRLRKQLFIEMAENDTFRKVLWFHLQAKKSWKTLPVELPDPISFLVHRIKSRRQSLIAQSCLVSKKK